MKKNLLKIFTLATLMTCLIACGNGNENTDTGQALTDNSDNIITTDSPVSGGETPEDDVASSDTENESQTSENESFPASDIAPPAAEKQAFYDTLTKDREIPIISIYTEDRAEILSLEEYVNCVVDVFNCDKSFAMNEIPAGIRVRGNSSAYYGDVEQIRANKAPYRIKFAEKQGMLGLNDGAECKSWVLLKTEGNLIPNDIAFRMGRAIMDGHAFCTDSTFVHLYVNEEFYGIYLLCEQSQVNKNRVDISEPVAGYEGTDIGYYLELDNYAWSDPTNIFFTHRYANGSLTDIEGVYRSFAQAEYTIKSDVTSDAQVTFIDRYMNNLFTALYDACENDIYQTLDESGNLVSSDYTSSYEVADALLDLESVVNMYILHEIVHSYDCGEGSFYMCIDFSPDSKCTKLQFTSPWDFNWAYADEAAGQYYAAAFCDEEFMKEYGDRSNPWFVLLMQEDWFLDMVREKWTTLHENGTLEDCLKAEEDYLATYEKDMLYAGENVLYAADYLLDWIRTRIGWLDEQWLLE